MVRFVLYLASLLFSSLSLLSSAFDCINDVGKPVDSWLIIKKPKRTEYFYYDSYYKLFNTSPISLNDTLFGALTYTIKQLWSSNTNYVLYNDQIPKLDTYYNDLY